MEDFWDSPGFLDDELSDDGIESVEDWPGFMAVGSERCRTVMSRGRIESQVQGFMQGPSVDPCFALQSKKKGWGPESKARAPDPHDSYDFQRCSPAYARLTALGYKFIRLEEIVHLSSKIEDVLLSQDKAMTERNRAARRRKPNAFHWLDENWSEITPQIYDSVAFAVLGHPAFPRIRRRHGVKP
jgi:hypothetical protein